MPPTSSNINIDVIVRTLKECLKDRPFPVSLHAPVFSGNEWRYVKECIDSAWVSSVGKFVDQFEVKLCELTGVKRAIATVNGTAALHVALKLLGVGVGDEVLVPTLTFVATVNAITYTGAQPHFVDSEMTSFGVDAAKLMEYLKKIGSKTNGGFINRVTGRRIKVLIAVHIFGFPADLDALQALCVESGITLIEDAAESLGSLYKGRHTGNCGKLSILSFNGNKIITTGGGGAILTQDEQLADRAKHMTTTAKIAHPYLFSHDEVGYNYRMPNINAALGVAQLENLAPFIEKKRAMAARYETAFAAVPGVRFVSEPAYSRSNYWLGCLLLDGENRSSRDELLKVTNQEGIGTRPCWTLMHKLRMYRDAPRMDLSVAEDIESRLINIPNGVAG